MLVVAVNAAAAGPGAGLLAGGTLNGHPLGALPAATALAAGAGMAPAARDVTAVLLPRNLLHLRLAPPPPPHGAGRGALPEGLARVWLEIQSDAAEGGSAEGAGGSRSR